MRLEMFIQAEWEGWVASFISRGMTVDFNFISGLKQVGGAIVSTFGWVDTVG